MSYLTPLDPCHHCGLSQVGSRTRDDIRMPSNHRSRDFPTSADIKQDNTLYVTKNVRKIIVLSVLSQISQIGYIFNNTFRANR